MQVDSYFWSIYKQVRPSVEQQAAMTEIWAQWERRKRLLDEHMHAARALLEALPAHVPLPHEFLAHLNALVATRLLTSSAPASTVADTQNQAAHQRPPHAPPTPPFPEFCTSGKTADKSALIYHLESCFCDSSSSHSNHAQMHSSGSSGCVTNGSVNKAPSSGGLSAGLAAKHDRMEGRVRFLGQCSRAMEAADGALEALQGAAGGGPGPLCRRAGLADAGGGARGGADDEDVGGPLRVQGDAPGLHGAVPDGRRAAEPVQAVRGRSALPIGAAAQHCCRANVIGHCNVACASRLFLYMIASP